MDDDDGDQTEYDTVIVPVSLIHKLSFEMVCALEEWHEERQLEEVDLQKCFVAMMAAVEATMERMTNASKGQTLQ